MKQEEYVAPRRRAMEKIREEVLNLPVPNEDLDGKLFACEKLKKLPEEIQPLYELRFGKFGQWIKYGGECPWLEDIEILHLTLCQKCKYDLLRA